MKTTIKGASIAALSILLAVPIVASIKICLINLPRTRVFGTLLGR